MRIRRPTALLALLAMTLSFAEAVWASSCPPGMPMERAQTQAAADDCMGTMTSEGADPAKSVPGSPGDPHCPFAPLSTPGSCIIAASHPAPVPPADLHGPEGKLLPAALPPSHDILLVTRPFHPPKA